jgi:hypothetical protein
VRAGGRPRVGAELFGLCSCGPVYWLGGGGQEALLVFGWVFVGWAGEGASGQSAAGYEVYVRAVNSAMSAIEDNGFTDGIIIRPTIAPPRTPTGIFPSGTSIAPQNFQAAAVARAASAR